MNSRKIIAGALVILGMIAGMGFGMLQNAEAKNGGKHWQEAHDNGSTLEIHISDNGDVLVRGAKVTAVAGGTISASTAWDDASMNWSVATNANTSFVHRGGGATGLASIAVGDIISFSGSISGGTGSALSVSAKAVKDWSKTTPVNVKTTVEGTAKSAPAANAPTSFVLTVGGRDYTVRVAADTSILNVFWLRSPLSNVRAGDKVRVYGMVNADMTIDATVVRDVSLK